MMLQIPFLLLLPSCALVSAVAPADDFGRSDGSDIIIPHRASFLQTTLRPAITATAHVERKQKKQQQREKKQDDADAAATARNGEDRFDIDAPSSDSKQRSDKIKKKKKKHPNNKHQHHRRSKAGKSKSKTHKNTPTAIPPLLRAVATKAPSTAARPSVNNSKNKKKAEHHLPPPVLPTDEPTVGSSRFHSDDVSCCTAFVYCF